MAYEPPKHCTRCGHLLGPIENRPGQRQCLAPDCARITYLSPIPVVAAIVQRGDEIILVRSHGWPESWYGLVTGFLEPEESPDAAARRELVEELGLEPGATTLIGAYPFAQMNQVIIAYHIRASGEIRLDESELAGFKIVPVDRLQPWPFGTGAAVRDFLARRAAAGDE
jgi:NAD+ diphosphatase